MLRLSDGQEERALRLHRDSFVYDFSPLGEPFVLTDRQRAVMRAAMEAGNGVRRILGAMADDRVLELARDDTALKQLRHAWTRSGVNAVQLTLGALELGIADWDAVVRDVARCYARQHLGYARICTSADDLVAAAGDGVVGFMLGLQDTACIGPELSRLHTLYGFGVRVIQLTYNRRNLVGDGCTERDASGLSRFGVRMVQELNELGVVIDVSHCGDATTLDALEQSIRPIAFTHVSCRALNDHPRAKTDEQLAILAATGGYVGILAVPFFLTQAGAAGVEDMMRHVAHAAEIVGTERVGIATDWGFWSTDFPAELRPQALEEFQRLGFRPEDGLQMNVALEPFVEWTDWCHITRGLVALGLSDDEVRGILGGNWLAYLRRT